MSDTFSRIAEIVSQSLDCDISDISSDSNLLTDLGLESIDMLDVTFRIEREFGVKFSREGVFQTWLFSDDNEWIDDGILTGEGCDKVVEDFPFLARPEEGSEPKSILTVGLLVGCVDRAIRNTPSSVA